MSTPTASSSIGSTSDRSPLPSSENVEKGKGTLTDWLHAELNKTIRHLQFLETTANVAWWWCTLLVVFALAVVLDHWLWVLPTFARYLFWLLGVGLSLFWILRRILPLFIFRIHPLYAAKVVENAVPELKNRLISWWELKHEPQAAPRGVVAAVGRQAVAQLRTHDASALLDTRPMIISIGIALSLTVFMSLYSLVAPRSAWTTAERIMFPWKTIAPPARVNITQVRPGSSVIPQSLPCLIQVEAAGLLSDEKAFVRFTSADRQILDQRFELTPKIAGSTFEGTLTTDGRGVQQDVEYWIEAGDAVAGPYSLKVNPLPQLTIDKVRLTFPSYTKLPPAEQNADGNIEAVEGTRVELISSLTGDVSKSFIEFFSLTPDGKAQKSLRSEPIAIEGTQGKATFTIRLNSQRENPTLETYTLRALDAGGNSEPNPLFFPLRVTGDFAPEIRLSANSESPLQVSPRGSLAIQLTALDPDFGLANVDVEIRKGSFVLETLKLLEEPEGLREPWNKKFQIRLAKWRLQNGDKITLTAIAKDNRRQPGTDTPEPNVTRSNSMEVNIVEPKEPEKGSNPDAASNPDAPPVEEIKEENSSKPNSSKSEQPANNQGNNGKKSESGSSGSGSSGSGGSQSESQDPNNSSGDSASSSDSSNNQKPNSSNNSSGGQSSDNSKSEPSKSEGNSQGGSSEGSDQQPSQNKDPSNAAEQNASNQNSSGKSEGNSEQSNSKPSTAENGEGRNTAPPDHDGDIMERLQDRMQREQGKNNPNNNAKPGDNSANDDSASDGNNKPSAGNQNGDKPNPANKNNADSKPSDGNSAGMKSEDGSDDQSGDNSQPNTKPKDGSTSKDSTGNPGENKPNQQDDSQGGSNSPQNKESKPGNEKSSDSTSKNPNGSKQEGNNSKSNSDPKQGNDDQAGSQSKDGADSSQGNKDSNQGSSGSEGKQGADGKQNPDGKQGSEGKQNPEGKQGSEGKEGSDSQGGSESMKDSGSKDGSDSPSATDSKPKDGQGKAAGEKNGSGNEQNPGAENGNKNDQGNGQESGAQKGQQGNKGNQQNPGNQTGAGEQANGAAQNAGNNAGQPQTPGDQKGGQPGQNSGDQANSKANPATGDGQRNGSMAGDNSQGINANDGAQEANLDYAKEATNLALDYLERQKDQPDPELLKEMNWTKEDLNRFLERWKKTLDSLDKNGGQREIAEQDLRSLGLRPPKSKAGAVAGNEDQLRDLQDSGPRVAPPKSLKSQFESVKKALQQRQNKKQD